MSLSGLLNQTATLYNKSSYSADGRENLGSGSSIRVRLQPKAKRVLMPDGSVLTIDAIAFAKASETINTDDKITYNSITYKVVDAYPVPGMNGQTHHQELRLQKWQLT